MRRLIVASLAVSLSIVAARTAARAGSEKVRLDTSDGVALVGDWYPPDRTPAPGVLLAHPLGGRRSDWSTFANQLQREGFAVLAVDLRGHGDSTRQGARTLDYRRMSDRELHQTIHDLQAAYDFLESRSEVDDRRIGAVGAASGAHHALRFAARERGIKSLILLSPPSEFRGMNTRDSIRGYGERPLMIVASLDDRPAAQASRRLEDLASGKKKLKLYDRAGHGISMLRNAKNLAGLMTEWLDDTL